MIETVLDFHNIISEPVCTSTNYQDNLTALLEDRKIRVFHFEKGKTFNNLWRANSYSNYYWIITDSVVLEKIQQFDWLTLKQSDMLCFNKSSLWSETRINSNRVEPNIY